MDPPADNWLHGFQNYGWVHLVTVAICAAVCLWVCRLGRRWRRDAPDRERRLRIVWVIVLVGVQGYNQAWWLWPSNFVLEKSLPLHFCDFSPWFVPFALLTRVRLARTMLYFWALALSTWAFFMPVLTKGPAHTEFWLFWIVHTLIVASAIYTVAVLDYRPRLKDLIIAGCITTAYSLAMIAFNVRFDLDYAYVGPSSTATAILGPWPWRLLAIIPGQWLLFALVWLPLARRREPEPSPPGATEEAPS